MAAWGLQRPNRHNVMVAPEVSRCGVTVSLLHELAREQYSPSLMNLTKETQLQAFFPAISQLVRNRSSPADHRYGKHIHTHPRLPSTAREQPQQSPPTDQHAPAPDHSPPRRHRRRSRPRRSRRVRHLPGRLRQHRHGMLRGWRRHLGRNGRCHCPRDHCGLQLRLWHLPGCLCCRCPGPDSLSVGGSGPRICDFACRGHLMASAFPRIGR